MLDYEAMTETSNPADGSPRLERVVGRARLALALEQVWPRLLPLMTIIGLFVALSWFGLWRLTPDLLRYGLLAAFAGAAVAALVVALRTPVPTRAQAIRRVERRSGLRHRPASGLDDRMSPVADDQAARTLWQANRLRLLATLKNLRAGAPDAAMARRDPDGWRFVVPVLLVVAFAIANGEHWIRVGEAFDGGARAISPFQARIDAWIDPPTYTRQPPIFLSRRNAPAPGDPASGTAEPNAAAGLAVPAGSQLTVRIVSRSAFTVELEAADGTIARLAPADGAAGATAEATADEIADDIAEPAADGQTIRSYSAVLDADGAVTIHRGNARTRYAFTVIPDRPPTIRRGEVTINRTGSFNLDFEIADDYGVREGSVVFRPAAPQPADARPLVTAPTVDMRLGRSQVKEGSARAYVRLDDHPYAGMAAFADATVTDDAGQTGRPDDTSEGGDGNDGEMVLPIRPFHNPIARALVEQRRLLALDANARDRVAHALDALTLYPEIHIRDSAVYLGLTIGYRRLTRAQTDDQLRKMLDYLWAMARQIEDGVLTDAEERLNAAREALQEALERGADEEEIARLMDELRQAMDEFLQQLARQLGDQAPDLSDLMPNLDGQVMTPQDLQNMLDRIEDLARLGDMDSARELLSELQALLDNLRAAQNNQAMQGQNSEMMRQLEELGRLMREQQQLMDETFQLDQGNRPERFGEPGERRPMTPEELGEILRQLQEGQQNLAGDLQELLDQLQGGMTGQQPGAGQQPGEGQQPGQGSGMQSFGRAGEAMDDAARSLGQGESGRAYGRQGDALQALRDGLEGMLQQMFSGQGQGDQRLGQGPNRPPIDPLGRPQRTQGPDLGENVEIPDEIDVERARRILNAIRERLGERFRPRFELDYLERLLKTE